MNRRRAVYPGSFDPITNGHLDILRRALGLVDEVVIAIAYNHEKPSGLFTVDERIEMIRDVTEAFGKKIRIDSFHGLLVDYARRAGAGVIIRGLRAVADFEYEFQMAGMNQQLNSTIETLFLMADASLQPIASKLVKEIALFGGDVSRFVSPSVREEVVARVEELGRKGDF